MSSGSAEANHGALPAEQTVAQTESSAAPRLDARSTTAGSIDMLLAATAGSAAVAAASLQDFLAAKTVARSLDLWFGNSLPEQKSQIVRRLTRHIGEIDELLNDQINAILHHASFQKLEASWRGLHYLARQASAEGEPNVRVKVLNATWKELERDFERSTEFDQSQLFRKVYDQEFGTPGGEPYGALVGDFEIHPRPSSSHPHDDIATLKAIGQVAAAAFCPFIASASPAMFGLDDFSKLEQRLDHAKTMEQMDYLKWRALRETEDARFVGLALPRVLMRTPYEDDGTRIDRFTFHEDVAGLDCSKYLWGNAAYAFGAVLVRAYAQSGWLADIRGVQRGVEGGGLVVELPEASFGTDKRGVAAKTSTDVVITDELEKHLADIGFVPLCDCKDTKYSAFYSNQSVQKPKKYDRPAGTTNAKLSSMLQYMLCVSRFAHYIKVQVRDKVGTFAEPNELQEFLNSWVATYVTTDSSASQDTKARFPLREAKVQVREQPGKPGSYQCVMHLAPHYELDELTAAVRISTELVPSRNT
jgi:type VI secretion system ImpC/EvpB family protein